MDDNNTYVMVHNEQKEGQEFKLIPIDMNELIFEIQYACKDYDQINWKLYVPVEGDQDKYRVVLSKDKSSKWKLLPSGDIFVIQELVSECNLTCHKETFVRDSASNFAYVTSPGMSGDVWKLNDYDGNDSISSYADDFEESPRSQIEELD